MESSQNCPILARVHWTEVRKAMEGAPYIEMSQPDKALRWLRERVEDARDNQALLEQYPETRLRFLEPHYETLRALGRMGPGLLGTMLDESAGMANWRCAIQAGFLCALNPAPWQREALVRCVKTQERGRWIFEMALARSHGLALAHVQAHLDLIDELSRRYGAIRIPAIAPRPAIDPALARRRQAEILAASRQGGARGARSKMIELGMDDAEGRPLRA